MRGQKPPAGANKQKIISICKEPCDKQHVFAQINIEAINQAAKQLSPLGFKTWIYLAKNQPIKHWELSSKHAVETFGFTDTNSFQRGIKELIEKGFLNLQEDNDIYPNSWNFVEIAVEQERENDPSIKPIEGASRKSIEGLPLNQLKPSIKSIEQIEQDRTINKTNLNNTRLGVPSQFAHTQELINNNQEIKEPQNESAHSRVREEYNF